MKAEKNENPEENKMLYIFIYSIFQVEDLSRNGKGGYADIVAGGINTNFVNLIFESQQGEDILFSVTIYATYPGAVLSAEPKNVPAAPPV